MPAREKGEWQTHDDILKRQVEYSRQIANCDGFSHLQLFLSVRGESECHSSNRKKQFIQLIEINYTKARADRRDSLIKCRKPRFFAKFTDYYCNFPLQSVN